MAKYGFMFTRGVLFFLAEDGFYGIGGQQSGRSARTRSIDWFLLNSDPKRRARDVLLRRSAQAARAVGILFVRHLGRITTADLLRLDRGAVHLRHRSRRNAWGTLAAPGVDLDTDIPGDALDVPLDSIRPSLDSTLYEGGRPIIAAIDVNGILCFDGRAADCRR